MKKTALIIAALLSSSVFAANWSHMSFPTKNPYFTSTSTFDTTNNVKMNIGCLKDYKNTFLLDFKNLKMQEKSGEVKITQSLTDKKEVLLKGVFETSEDGVVNVILPIKKQEIESAFKKLNGVDISFIKDGKVIKELKYSLKGSSHALNIFDKKCKKL